VTISDGFDGAKKLLNGLGDGAVTAGDSIRSQAPDVADAADGMFGKGRGLFLIRQSGRAGQRESRFKLVFAEAERF
jgi:hypothetical protein